MTSVWAFFALVAVLAIPFWLAGALHEIQLLPGLPLAGLTFICPGLAAWLLVSRATDRAGGVAFLRRALDYDRVRNKIWYLPALLLAPTCSALSWAWLRATAVPVPSPQFEVLRAATLCVLFFIGAVGEELGWSGYATEPLQVRYRALCGSLVLGAVWVVFHFAPLVEAHRSMQWIGWWSLGTLATRVIMVWLYNNTGRSVFAVSLFHMSQNVAWQEFPIHASWFDPRVSSLISAAVALTVVLVYGPRTLTGRRSRLLPAEISSPRV
jgi:membrane protease YdiL (CAAX protease family)